MEVFWEKGYHGASLRDLTGAGDAERGLGLPGYVADAKLRLHGGL